MNEFKFQRIIDLNFSEQQIDIHLNTLKEKIMNLHIVNDIQ